MSGPLNSWQEEGWQALHHAPMPLNRVELTPLSDDVLGVILPPALFLGGYAPLHILKNDAGFELRLYQNAVPLLNRRSHDAALSRSVSRRILQHYGVQVASEYWFYTPCQDVVAGARQLLLAYYWCARLWDEPEDVQALILAQLLDSSKS